MIVSRITTDSNIEKDPFIFEFETDEWDSGNKPVIRKEDVTSQFEKAVSDISFRRTINKEDEPIQLSRENILFKNTVKSANEALKDFEAEKA